MQSCLNGVHISEVSKILAESPRETTHRFQILDLFDASHQLITPLQLSSVIGYFDMYSQSTAEYENEEIPIKGDQCLSSQLSCT